MKKVIMMIPPFDEIISVYYILPTWRLQDLKSGVQSPLGARVWSYPSFAAALEQAQNCKPKSDKRKENKKMSGGWV